MCTTVKSPTPKEPEKKDPIYMRNPYLDGLGIGAETRGRNSFRIDPGSARATPGKRVVPKMGYDDGAPLKWNTSGSSSAAGFGMPYRGGSATISRQQLQ